MKRYRRLAPFALLAAMSAFLSGVAQAAIPSSERDVLDALYTQSNGAGWFNSTGWEGASGTECSWFGVTCDGAGDHVIAVYLPSNHLVGTLPDLSGLPQLQTFSVYLSQLTGNIPSLAGLPNLRYFAVSQNQFTGSLPSLTGHSNLQYFRAERNQLTGSIPSLAGLSNLYFYLVDHNQLTGHIPSLADLTSLQILSVGSNDLSGTVPAAPASLSAAQSTLCNNALTHTDDPAWDAATGITPWYSTCTLVAPAVTAVPEPAPLLSRTLLALLAFTVAALGMAMGWATRRQG